MNYPNIEKYTLYTDSKTHLTTETIINMPFIKTEIAQMTFEEYKYNLLTQIGKQLNTKIIIKE